MSDNSTIEWTDATWNPITGCSVVSPGCTNCYAMVLAGTRLKHHWSRKGLTQDTKTGPVWNGQVRLNEEWLDQPLRWKRPRMIFVCAHGDLFHESVPDNWIDRVFAVMALAPQHTFQVLSKRAKRMREYLAAYGAAERVEDAVYNRLEPGHGAEQARDWLDEYGVKLPLPNVWLGVSAEDQRRADERIVHLLETPAAARFVSAEPLLGGIDFCKVEGKQEDVFRDAMTGAAYKFVREQRINIIDPLNGPRLDWIIVGGESGNGARPMHPNWARSIRDQCGAAGVPFFFKQWGEYYPEGQPVACGGEDHDPDRCDSSTGELMFRVGKKAAGRLLDGVTHDGMPGRTG